MRPGPRTHEPPAAGQLREERARAQARLEEVRRGAGLGGGCAGQALPAQQRAGVQHERRGDAARHVVRRVEQAVAEARVDGAGAGAAALALALFFFCGGAVRRQLRRGRGGRSRSRSRSRTAAVVAGGSRGGRGAARERVGAGGGGGALAGGSGRRLRRERRAEEVGELPPAGAGQHGLLADGRDERERLARARGLGLAPRVVRVYGRDAGRAQLGLPSGRGAARLIVGGRSRLHRCLQRRRACRGARASLPTLSGLHD